MNLVKRTDNWFPSIFDDMLRTDWAGGISNTAFKTPAVNIKENEGNFEIEVAAPGVDKKDFSIEVDGESLIIASEKKEDTSETKENYTRKEFNYTSFKRVFTLPETVEGAAISASYKNGILLISLPKKEEAKPEPKRMIEIA